MVKSIPYQEANRRKLTWLSAWIIIGTTTLAQKLCREKEKKEEEKEAEEKEKEARIFFKFQDRKSNIVVVLIIIGNLPLKQLWPA